ncbi:hypothetical protein [Ruegeria arenilitoris]|uniref:hypothetical protein n=1 Tax=Ruegeria arenilitoris TaxID=1173585 RepID=UPI0020C2395C|nr:hypothetical protein [Ruegeria arenilitoris]
MTKAMQNLVPAVLLALPPIAGAGLASAENTQDAGGVTIELSSAVDQDQGCLLSFVVENAYPADIDGAVYETVLFGAQGEVALLTLLDFQDLPAGRPRVRQFKFAGLACNQISRILINGAQDCAYPGDPADACLSGLTLRSRLETELIG